MQAARAAGIADDLDEDIEATRSTQINGSGDYRNSAYPDQRVPIPRRSFSIGRKTPAASIRSRANSVARTHDDHHRRTASQQTAASTKPAPIDDSKVDTLPGEGPKTDEEAGDERDYPWNSLHPCWPHLNPHVPMSSTLYASTRIIRVQRDYRTAGDLYPAFETLYPEILEGCLSQDAFGDLIRPLNELLKRVYDPFDRRHWLDATLGVLTAWAWEDAGLTKVKRGTREIESYISRWNAQHGRSTGVEVISLARTAYLCLDIQVPDPSAWLLREGADEVAAEADNGDMADPYTDASALPRPSTGHTHEQYSGRPSTDLTRGMYAGDAFTDDGMSHGRTSTMGSTSMRFSETSGRRGHLGEGRSRPDVPPIPREYLARDGQ